MGDNEAGTAREQSPVEVALKRLLNTIDDNHSQLTNLRDRLASVLGPSTVEKAKTTEGPPTSTAAGQENLVRILGRAAERLDDLGSRMAELKERLQI